MRAPRHRLTSGRDNVLMVASLTVLCAVAAVVLDLQDHQAESSSPPEAPPWIVPMAQTVTASPTRSDVLITPRTRAIPDRPAAPTRDQPTSAEPDPPEAQGVPGKTASRPALAVAGLTAVEATDILEGLDIARSLRRLRIPGQKPGPDLTGGQAMQDLIDEILPMLPHYLEAGIVTYTRRDNPGEPCGTWGTTWTNLSHMTAPPEFLVTIDRHPADITFRIRSNVGSPASWVRIEKD